MNYGSAPKTAAERQRLRRERQRQGVRVVPIVVSDEAIAALESSGLLDDADLAAVLGEVVEESVIAFARNGKSHT